MNRSKNVLEFLIILFLGFGLFWYSSYLSITQTADEIHIFSTGSFVELVVGELFLFLIIAIILKWRNWKMADFHLHFTFSMIGIALLLVITRLGIGYGIEVFLEVLDISTSTKEYQLAAGLTSIILVLIINSVYEEFLLLGYIFKRLENFNPVVIILFSMLIRESYHLYQGWEKLPMAISIGLVFGWYYYKFKKIWPPIIAHAIFNALAFLSLHYGWKWI